MNKSLVMALAASATLLCAGAAKASDVAWSVRIGAPRIGAVISSGPAYFRAPAYYAPAPVAYAPVPVYSAPPAFYDAAPVAYAPVAYYPRRAYVRPVPVFYPRHHRGWIAPYARAPIWHHHGPR